MNTLRREQRQNQFRREILDAARELFSELGYEAFSMRELARRLGCSHGNLYPYFENKEQLFDCLVEEVFAQLYEELQRLSTRHVNGDPVSLVKAGMRIYVDFGLRHPHAYKLAFILGGKGPHRPWKPHAAFEFLRGAVRRCAQEKRFRPVDVETTSQVFWTAVHGVTSLLILRPSFPWVSRDKLIRQVIESAVAGLLPQPQAMRRNRKGRSHVERSRP
jgi:AcrR family transcriptional regulator